MINTTSDDTLIIDGYEIPKKNPSWTDFDNFNAFLRSKLQDFYIQDFLSHRHPEIFPRHISMRSKEDYSLEVVFYLHHTFSDGEYAPGWNCYAIKDSEVYKEDILEFYESADPEFYNFIKKRL